MFSIQSRITFVACMHPYKTTFFFTFSFIPLGTVFYKRARELFGVTFIIRNRVFVMHVIRTFIYFLTGMFYTVLLVLYSCIFFYHKSIILVLTTAHKNRML